MRSGQRKAMDDYDDYLSICSEFNLQHSSYHTIYDHMDVIFSALGVKNVYEFWPKIRELRAEGWDNDHIKDFYKLK